jgi:hypothetical protein
MTALFLKRDYSRRGAIGMAIDSSRYPAKQQLVAALESVIESADGLNLYVAGQPLAVTCEMILSNIQHTAVRDGVEVIIQSGQTKGAA